MSFIIHYKNVISICGSGRNVGKTLLGESIISTFSKEHAIVAIKISKFKHQNHDKDKLKELFKNSNYTIWKELSFSDKDSGRFLKAGAKSSIYIECDDLHLLEAFQYAKNNYISRYSLIICESASISKYIMPGIIIFVKSVTGEIPQNKLNYFEQSNIVLLSNSPEILNPHLFLGIDKNNDWFIKRGKYIQLL